ncbi:unnamed protein product [Cuscuta epithymum]|uniref:Uncharacterized protein n=1 Tax=Cuscuta epithymum TaxID=186058 RepID=A0AAV0F1N9_9ASTE|nr:unnamed protein product [Cuscuta epithymum]
MVAEKEGMPSVLTMMGCCSASPLSTSHPPDPSQRRPSPPSDAIILTSLSMITTYIRHRSKSLFPPEFRPQISDALAKTTRPESRSWILELSPYPHFPPGGFGYMLLGRYQNQRL